MNELSDAICIVRKGEKLTIRAYKDPAVCVAVFKEMPASAEEFLLRIHSSCLFGEAFSADDCDCGPQLSVTLDLIGEKGGMVIYCFEEGRGIGLVNKISAIALEQKENLNTAQAFEMLGYRPDERDLNNAIDLMKLLDVPQRISFISNNPLKIDQLEKAGYSVNRYKMEVPSNPSRDKYLHEKQECLGHHR